MLEEEQTIETVLPPPLWLMARTCDGCTHGRPQVHHHQSCNDRVSTPASASAGCWVGGGSGGGGSGGGGRVVGARVARGQHSRRVPVIRGCAVGLNEPQTTVIHGNASDGLFPLTWLMRHPDMTQLFAPGNSSQQSALTRRPPSPTQVS